jgi:cytochrome c-type biogenesis protein CcmE
MKPRHQRFAMIGGGLAALAVAAAFVLTAFRENLVFFFTPSQIAANEVPHGRAFRIGGMVEPGSVKRQPDGVTVQFMVTDTAKSVKVVFRGILPDLFREGKGVVTQGRLGPDGTFVASEVLAKHDENYMPPAAADAIKQAQSVNEKAAHTLVDPHAGGRK